MAASIADEPPAKRQKRADARADEKTRDSPGDVRIITLSREVMQCTPFDVVVAVIIAECATDFISDSVRVEQFSDRTLRYWHVAFDGQPDLYLGHITQYAARGCGIQMTIHLQADELQDLDMDAWPDLVHECEHRIYRLQISRCPHSPCRIILLFERAFLMIGKRRPTGPELLRLKRQMLCICARRGLLLCPPVFVRAQTGNEVELTRID